MKNSDSIHLVLDLRIKTTISLDNEFVDKTKTLMSQDCSYYRNSTGFMNASDREKMAQWEYRIVDHFDVPRYLVGIAFSFLDRFTAKCTCDRQAYKLAAMTSLFTAMKLHNPRRFSINTLAALSRGEFNASQIAQMELIMLKTLDWRLSPPTTQSFIHVWGRYLIEGGYDMEPVERAIFLAEIAVFDTLLASKERALIAMAALVDSVECGKFKQTDVNALRKIKNDFGLYYPQEDICRIRNRLRYIFSKTSQCLTECRNQSEPAVQEHTRIERESLVTISENIIKMKHIQSPRSVRARCEQGSDEICLDDVG